MKEEIEKAINSFLSELKFSGKSRRTIEAYSFHLAKLKAFCEEKSLDYRQINGKESKAFRNWLAEKPLSPTSVNAVYIPGSSLKGKIRALSPTSINATLSACKSFYDFLLDEGLVKGNPFVSKKLRVKEPDKKPAFLTEEELKKVKSAMKLLPYHVRLAFETMLWTGLRVSEVASLTGEDVIKEDGKVFLRVRTGKGKKERIVPIINKDIAKALLKLAKQKRKEILFGVTDGTLKDYAHKIKKATGVNFHTHRLRHTFATRLLSQGIGLDVVQKILGHTSINTTRRYTETLPEKIFNLAVKL